jgi:hypothetical protein
MNLCTVTSQEINIRQTAVSDDEPIRPGGDSSTNLTNFGDSGYGLLDRLVVAFEAARDPARAAGTAAYMRNQFAFLGIPVPLMTTIARQVTADLPPPTGDSELAAVTLACWELPEREYQHFGVWYARHHVSRAGPGFVPALERLVTSRSWWDTVDRLATGVAGPLVLAHPELVRVVDRWIEADNFRLARVAILHQMTDSDWRLEIRWPGAPDRGSAPRTGASPSVDG